MFMEDGKYYVALYHKAERIFKIHFDMGADPIKPSIYSNDMDEIIYVERGRVSDFYQIHALGWIILCGSIIITWLIMSVETRRVRV